MGEVYDEYGAGKEGKRELVDRLAVCEEMRRSIYVCACVRAHGDGVDAVSVFGDLCDLNAGEYWVAWVYLGG